MKYFFPKIMSIVKKMRKIRDARKKIRRRDDASRVGGLDTFPVVLIAFSSTSPV